MPFPAQNNYGVVLLAAGKSSRLGSAKQLLVFEGQSLIKRAALIALEVSNKLIVVTGAQQEKIRIELASLDLLICFNEDYEEGIASSIRVGLAAIKQYFPGVEGVLFIVCDQPYISPALLQRLMQKASEAGKPIVACSYNNTLGIPVLFQKNYFPLLLQLKGDHGGKKIIENHLDDVAVIDFPEGGIDIDTIEDYERLEN